MKTPAQMADHLELAAELTRLGNSAGIATARSMLAHRQMLEALEAAIALADRRLADWPMGRRTDECQAIYDQCAAAVAAAKGGE